MITSIHWKTSKWCKKREKNSVKAKKLFCCAINRIQPDSLSLTIQWKFIDSKLQLKSCAIQKKEKCNRKKYWLQHKKSFLHVFILVHYLHHKFYVYCSRAIKIIVEWICGMLIWTERVVNFCNWGHKWWLNFTNNNYSENYILGISWVQIIKFPWINFHNKT